MLNCSASATLYLATSCGRRMANIPWVTATVVSASTDCLARALLTRLASSSPLRILSRSCASSRLRKLIAVIAVTDAVTAITVSGNPPVRLMPMTSKASTC